MGDVLAFDKKKFNSEDIPIIGFEPEVPGVTAISIVPAGRCLEDIWMDFFTVTITMPCCERVYQITPMTWPKEEMPCGCGGEDNWVVKYEEEEDDVHTERQTGDTETSDDGVGVEDL